MSDSNLIPLPVKFVYTAFMAILIPVYLYHYGPTNFLYFCDIAILITLVAVWTESALLVSMCAVGIIAPQLIWVADYVANFAGIKLTGMTDYMFNEKSSLFLRGLSLFHGWLPFLLIYLVWRLGYDRRGLAAWSAVAVAALLICFFFMPGPRPNPGMTPVNINYVWGMGETAAQTFVPAWVWFSGLVIGLPLLVFLPSHWLLCKFAPSAEAVQSGRLAPLNDTVSIHPAQFNPLPGDPKPQGL